jgi:hypothetical protein
VITLNEDIFEGWAKVFKNHHIVVAFCSKPANRQDADATSQPLVYFKFTFKLGSVCINQLKLNGNLLLRNNVDCEVDN